MRDKKGHSHLYFDYTKSLPKSKRSQAAMEFLMTYGWAILAAVIAIGVLAYFGVFSPGKYISGNAVVNPPFYITAANAKASTGITLAVKNNGGEDYQIFSVSVINCGTEDYSATPITITADETETIIIDCDPVLVEGNNIKGDITITYRKPNVGVDLTSTGTIAQKVVA